MAMLIQSLNLCQGCFRRSDKLARLHRRQRTALHQPFAAESIATKLQARRTLRLVEEAACCAVAVGRKRCGCAGPK